MQASPAHPDMPQPDLHALFHAVHLATQGALDLTQPLLDLHSPAQVLLKQKAYP